MRASSAFIKLFIRGLAWDAGEAEATFADTLKAAARGKLTDSLKGKVLTTVGGGGTTVTYTLPPLGDLTADDVMAVCSLILDKVDQIKAVTPDIADGPLVAALLAQFPSIRSTRPDFSTGLRR